MARCHASGRDVVVKENRPSQVSFRSTCCTSSGGSPSYCDETRVISGLDVVGDARCAMVASPPVLSGGLSATRAGSPRTTLGGRAIRTDPSDICRRSTAPPVMAHRYSRFLSSTAKYRCGSANAPSSDREPFPTTVDLESAGRPGVLQNRSKLSSGSAGGGTYRSLSNLLFCEDELGSIPP